MTKPHLCYNTAVCISHHSVALANSQTGAKCLKKQRFCCFQLDRMCLQFPLLLHPHKAPHMITFKYIYISVSENLLFKSQYLICFKKNKIKTQAFCLGKNLIFSSKQENSLLLPPSYHLDYGSIVYFNISASYL